VYDRACLIRLFAMGIPEWLEDKPNIERLIKIFDPTDEKHSVYEVESGEEEWVVAAAHALTSKNRPDAISILRLKEESLPRFGISLDRAELGTTGVPWVDHRHRNLRATIEQLRELVKWVVEECSRGNDLVRRIGKPSIDRTLRRLCAEHDGNCPPHVKNIAKWAIKEADTRNLDLTNIRQEMLAVEFRDEVVRPIAYFMGRGNHLADWYASIDALRQQYGQHYLPAIAKRFGLA
jgi:hypothetical protein